MSTSEQAQIDPFDPDLEPLRDILDRLPGKRKPPGVRTRWVKQGRNGLKLPAIKLSGAWWSTPDAVAEWIRQTSQPPESSAEGRSSDRASELHEAGLL